MVALGEHVGIQYLRMFLHQPDRSRRAIGYLSRFGDVMRVSFDADYIEDAGRPALSLAYRGDDEAATRAILQSSRDRRTTSSDGRWPAYFANLLPEGHNRERLALERHCSVSDDFELLAAAGHDLMGALEVEPVSPQEGIPDSVWRWHTALGLDVLEPAFVAAPVEDAASLPGMVTKFSAVMEGRRYVVKRHGAAGAFILKLPSTRHPDLVRNEHSGYRLCEALNLRCAQAEIVSRADADLPIDVPFDEILAVRRFDRGPDGRRIHMEEFAQAMQYEPRHKYGRGMVSDFSVMLQVLDRYSVQPVQDVREFIGRFVAFVLMGNTDAHLKNWALTYPDARQPMLAPLYDPVCVTAFFESVSPRDYGVNRAIDATVRAFGWDQLEAMLKGAQLRRVPALLRAARETVALAKADWPRVLADAPGSVQRAVGERLKGGVAVAA